MKKLTFILFSLSPLFLFPQSVRQKTETTKVDQMPTYPGGMKALARLFMDSVDQPSVKWEEREEADDHPELTLALVINEQGKVEDVKVIKPFKPKSDARCVNLARKLKFTPAMSGGKPVKVTYTLPLKFDLEY